MRQAKAADIFANKIMKEIGETNDIMTVNRLKEERQEEKERGWSVFFRLS